MKDPKYNGEEAPTHQQSLDLINEMISKAKKSYTSKGIASMVWGSLITFCGLANWVEIHFKKDFGDVWLLTLIALIPQIYFSIKEKRSKNFIAHNEIATNYIWIAFTLSMFITSYYFSHFNLGNVSTLIMMLFGISTFILGGMNKFKPMIVGRHLLLGSECMFYLYLFRSRCITYGRLWFICMAYTRHYFMGSF